MGWDLFEAVKTAEGSRKFEVGVCVCVGRFGGVWRGVD